METKYKTTYEQFADLSEFDVKLIIQIMTSHGLCYQKGKEFAIFLRLNNKTLEKVRADKNLLLDYTRLRKLYKQEGPNIHFILAYGTGVKRIYEALKDIKSKFNPKSVSWYSKDMKRFIYRRM